MILEVNLHDFVAQSEHDRVLGSHPFLDVDGAWWVLQFVGLVHLVSLDELLFLLWVIVLLKVGLEVLKQCHFLLQLLGVAWEIVLLHDILLFIGCDCFSLVVVKLGATRLSNNLSGIVEENASRHIREEVAETVFGGVIDPFGYPNLCSLIDGGCLPRSLRSLQNCILVNFERLLTNLLTSRRAFLRHSLYVFRRRWSDWRNRRHLGCLLLRLHLPLISYLWHFVALGILSLSAVNARSIGVNGRITLGHWSLTTIQSSGTRPKLVSRSSLFQATRSCARRLVTHSSLRNELSNVLARGWASQERLW